MIDLHREFVVQHNAQCDAENPVPDSVIIQVPCIEQIATECALTPHLPDAEHATNHGEHA